MGLRFVVKDEHDKVECLLANVMVSIQAFENEQHENSDEEVASDVGDDEDVDAVEMEDSEESEVSVEDVENVEASEQHEVIEEMDDAEDLRLDSSNVVFSISTAAVVVAPAFVKESIVEGSLGPKYPPKPRLPGE